MDRHTFLQLLSTGAASAVFSSIARALAIPANHATGTIADVEHIVFLMQENRSSPAPMSSDMRSSSGIIGAIQGQQGSVFPELRQKIRSKFARSTHVSGHIHKVALYQGSSTPDKEILQANADEAAPAPDDE